MGLRKPGERGERPLLKELVVEASQALSRLDAERLEELALSCQALTRELVEQEWKKHDGDGRTVLEREAREAAGDMAVFARVLEATRANLEVMNRLRELRAGRLEYGQPWRRMESGHGNN
jgi:hypothetical protein